MGRVLRLAIPLALGIVAGCTQNLANVRTFATGIKTVTGDVSNMATSDEASCRQNVDLQSEYAAAEHQALSPAPCDALADVLRAIAIENKALQAYGTALGNIAQDQFVDADTDSRSVTTTLQTVQSVSAPVATAIGSLFTLVETAALSGYRQHELSKVMNGPSADAVETLVRDFGALSSQYSVSLQHQLLNLDLMKGAFIRNHRDNEPLAVAEMSVRLQSLRSDIEQKITAVKAFDTVLATVRPAFNAALQDLNKPGAKELYTDVQAFAAKVSDAHDKLKKAFG